MKKLIFVLPFILLLGCAPTETVVAPEPTEINIEEIKEQLREEIKEEVKEEIRQEEAEKEPELTLETYDYRVDPDTVAVQINEDNMDEYIGTKIFELSNGTYSIRTYSPMYEKGYVVVGMENCVISVPLMNIIYEFEGETHPAADDPTTMYGCSNPFSLELNYGFSSEEKIKEYLKPLSEYQAKFNSPDAIIYYQKIEDVKFGYEVIDNQRIVNGVGDYVFNSECLY